MCMQQLTVSASPGEASASILCVELLLGSEGWGRGSARSVSQNSMRMDSRVEPMGWSEGRKGGGGDNTQGAGWHPWAGPR